MVLRRRADQLRLRFDFWNLDLVTTGGDARLERRAQGGREVQSVVGGPEDPQPGRAEHDRAEAREILSERDDPDEERQHLELLIREYRALVKRQGRRRRPAAAPPRRSDTRGGRPRRSGRPGPPMMSARP